MARNNLPNFGMPWPGREGLVPQLAAAMSSKAAARYITDTIPPLPTIIGQANPSQLTADMSIPQGSIETYPPFPIVIGEANSPQLPTKLPIKDTPDHELTKDQLQRRRYNRRKWGKKLNEDGLHYNEDEMYAELSEKQKKEYAEYMGWKHTVHLNRRGGTKYEVMYRVEAQENIADRQSDFENWATKEWAEEAARLADIRDCFDTCMESFLAIANDETQPDAKREAAKKQTEALAVVWEKGNFSMPAWGPSEKVHQEVGALELPVPAVETNNAGKQEMPIQVDSDTEMEG